MLYTVAALKWVIVSVPCGVKRAGTPNFRWHNSFGLLPFWRSVQAMAVLPGRLVKIVSGFVKGVKIVIGWLDYVL